MGALLIGHKHAPLVLNRKPPMSVNEAQGATTACALVDGIVRNHSRDADGQCDQPFITT